MEALEDYNRRASQNIQSYVLARREAVARAAMKGENLIGTMVIGTMGIGTMGIGTMGIGTMGSASRSRAHGRRFNRDSVDLFTYRPICAHVLFSSKHLSPTIC